MSAKNRARKHTISFYHAIMGVWHAIKTQPNLKVHLLIGAMVVLAGWWFDISRIEWLIILFTIMWVLVSEMINTSIEAVVDLISKEYSVEAKIAKDVAAGVVLVGAVGAVIVGVVIFGPYIFRIVN